MDLKALYSRMPAGLTKTCLPARQALRILNITAIILLSACLTASANGFSQITLSEKNAPLQKVLKKIQQQSGYEFLCPLDLLQKAGTVSVELKNASIEEAVRIVLNGKSLSYAISDKTVVIKEQPAIPNAVTLSVVEGPPPIDISGKILDEKGTPLPGATIKVKGTNLITTSNADGSFVLTGVDEKAVLVISYVGFETQTLAVKNNTVITVSMKKNDSPLDEVQVIAYGTTTKRLNTGNVSTVKAKDIEKSPVSNVLLALEGRVPGMEIIQANGLPGSGVTVRIRGQNSINNGNDPLYIIDGVPYLNQMLPGLLAITGTSSSSGSNAAYSSGNPLSYINPGDIESIDILKDADATAIYGTRGANGVVLITTKKGKAGPMRVDVNAQQGWGKVTRFIPWLNTRQYLDMRYEAYRNDGVNISTLTPRGNNYDLTLWDTTRYTDWNKELIGGTAQYSNIQLSMYGGSNNVQYRVGYNYNKQTTVFPGSFGDPKGSLSFSINSSSNNKKLQFQFSGIYQADKNELPSYDLSGFTNLSPNAPALHNQDGTLNWAPNPTTGYETWNNPLAALNAKYKRQVNNLVTNAMISYQLLPGLEIKTSVGFTNTLSNEVMTSPRSAVGPSWGNFYERSSGFSTAQNDSWIIEPQLSYSTHIAGGELSALAGTTIQQNNSKGQTIIAKGFNSDLVLEDAKAASSVQVESSLDALYRYNAIFGRVSYNWGNKYLLNLTARRDGTSRFGPDKQFANFGAAGLAWVFSKENFIEKNIPFLSFGKLRASYGTTGSDQIGDYQFLNLYRYENYTLPYQNSLSLVLEGLFNPNLAWESTKKLETALELGFWQDKVNLSVSFYRNRSSNQLGNYQLPLNTGANNVTSNLDASVQNTGWEFILNTTNIQSKAIRWTSSVNLSIPRNKLVSLSPGAAYFDKRLVGQSLFTQFVYSFSGVDPATGQYQFYDDKGGTTFRPDTAYDPITSMPTYQHPIYTGVQLFGGLQNSISWKGFLLDFLFQFEKRLGKTNQSGRYPGYFSSSIQNQPVTVLNRWRKPGDAAPIQRFNQNFSIYNSTNFLNSSDAAWVDASYIRLKNVSLSWQLPATWRQKMHLQNARIYTQAQNLLTFTKYKGSDPETRSLISLPPLQIITVGVQVTF
ncbi:MAG: SusC/RagA family TonB-linked outer membrane protein [Chitinophagaceae bacterium]